MQGFYIEIEKYITITELKDSMKRIFPRLNFYGWILQENMIDGVKDRELLQRDILMELTHKSGLFKTHIDFYRFPGREGSSRLDLFIGRELSNLFSCKTIIDGYSY